MVEIRMLHAGDEAVLAQVSPDTFDYAVDPLLAAEFLADTRHHIAVAVADGVVVGFASGVHYVHPDKPTELWVNEVGVADTHRGAGIAKQLMHALLQAGRAVGCTQAWVLTDRSNEPALRLYRSVGGVEAPGDTVMLEFPL